MQRNFIEINSQKISYLETGIRTKEPSIIFLHGWGLCSEAFKSLIYKLGEKHHVLAPDLPGFGQSDAFCKIQNPKQNYNLYSNLLKAFLDAKNLQKINLIGQSMGGGICLDFAAKYDFANRIILTNSAGVPMPNLGKIFIKRAPEVFGQILRSKFKKENLDFLKSFYRNLIPNMSNALNSLHIPTREDLREDLRRIKAECLIIHGEKDIMIPKSAVLEFKTLLPNSKLISLPKDHHEFALIYPERFSAYVFEYLA